jgi:predicted flap endonuclease-1-like 5' DNA nuclease
MNKPPDDISQWIQELIKRSASDQAVSQKRFEELVRRTTRGEVSQAGLRDEYLRFAQQEGLRYIRDLTRVGLGFYNTLLELNRQYNDRFYDHVLRTEPSPNGYGNGNGAASQVRLVNMEFHGAAGSDASRSFAIENQRSEAVTVGFLISEFTDADESVTFRPPVQFSPARFHLEPGQERMVSILIPLLKEFFIPGETYTATVIVSGFEQLQLRLIVSVTQEAEGKPAAKSRSLVFKPVDEEPAQPADAPDDLSRIKGIGEATLGKLLAGGITSFEELAACDAAALEILLGKNGAARAQSLKWQEQARLAQRGDWKALDALQRGAV